MDEKLMPCPFCGSVDIDDDGCAGRAGSLPVCDGCGAIGPDDTPNAIAAWNRRAAAPDAEKVAGEIEGEAYNAKLDGRPKDEARLLASPPPSAPCARGRRTWGASWAEAIEILTAVAGWGCVAKRDGNDSQTCGQLGIKSATQACQSCGAAWILPRLSTPPAAQGEAERKP